MISSALLLCITLAFFGDVIFSSKEEVLSRKGTDIFYEYVHTRHFGFNELRQGNLPLWNPHIFSGMPFQASGTYHHVQYTFEKLIRMLLPEELFLLLHGRFLFHLLLGGVSMFLLARALSLGRSKNH